jgi:hypothetical protein
MLQFSQSQRGSTFVAELDEVAFVAQMTISEAAIADSAANLIETASGASPGR